MGVLRSNHTAMSKAARGVFNHPSMKTMFITRSKASNSTLVTETGTGRLGPSAKAKMAVTERRNFRLSSEMSEAQRNMVQLAHTKVRISKEWFATNCPWFQP